MRKPIFCAALLTLILCLAASKASAQETWEMTAIWYDDSTNTVYGYSATEIDYYCEYDYSAYVEGYLYNQNGSIVDSGWDEEPDVAEVYTSASANSSAGYTQVGFHDVVERYYREVIDRSPDGCWPCDGCYTDCYYFQDDFYWYDTYGFSFISPGYYGPWWDIYGYGPATEVEDDEYEDLGETSASVTTASPDHLVVVRDQSGYTNLLPDGSTCQYGNFFMRQVGFQVVSQDSNGAQPVGDVVVRETFDSVSDNTCGNDKPEPTGCLSTTNNGTFIDSITVFCKGSTGPANCGYDIKWGWYWCGNVNRPIVKLASLTAQVRRDSVTLNGLATPGSWPAGTPFRR
jgi:hypothetical protein